MERQCKTAIIGGGISGLACAAWLRHLDPEHSVCVLERDAAPGGKMQTGREDGYQFERGPSTLLDNVAETRELIHALGMDDAWLSAREDARHRYIWKDGIRHQLPAAPRALLKALRTPLLSAGGKFRFACEPLMPKRDNAGESLRSFAQRRIGPEACASLIEPFACGIHAGDPERLEVESAFPKLVRAEREYGNLFPGMFKVARDIRGGGPRRPSKMRSFAGGMAELPNRIASDLGDAYVGKCVVECITEHAEGVTVQGHAGGEPLTLRAEHLVIATPSNAAAELLQSREHNSELAQLLASISMNRIALVHVGVRSAEVAAALDGFGHLVVREHGVRTLGTIYASALFDGRTPSPERALLSCFTGGSLDTGVLDLDDDAIGDFVLKDLRTALGYTGTPDFMRVIRWDEAFPQYHLGHAQRETKIAKLLESAPRLHLIGNYRSGLSVNDCIRLAVRTATSIATS